MALIIEVVSPSCGIQCENVRTKLAKFAVCMESVLKSKDAKYEGHQYDIGQLVDHLETEIKELQDELKMIPREEVTQYRLGRIMHECLDVANMCMYVHDECAALSKFNKTVPEEKP